jgi:hypothetical protein
MSKTRMTTRMGLVRILTMNECVVLIYQLSGFSAQIKERRRRAPCAMRQIFFDSIAALYILQEQVARGHLAARANKYKYSQTKYEVCSICKSQLSQRQACSAGSSQQPAASALPVQPAEAEARAQSGPWASSIDDGGPRSGLRAHFHFHFPFPFPQIGV